MKKRARRVLDDHRKLAQQRWTQAEKLTRRLQREFLQSRELLVDERDDS